VPCVIEKFEIKSGSGKSKSFLPDLAYRYDVAGTSYVGTRLWNHREGSDSYEDLSEVRDTLSLAPEGPLPSPAGVTSECYVDPSNPASSCLVRDGGGQIAFGLAFAAFGGFFVFIGLAIIFGGKSS